MRIPIINLSSILQKRSAKIIILSISIVFLYLLYIHNIAVLPYVVHGDEGNTALQAIEVINNPTHIIGVGWYDLPLLSFYPHAITMTIFGQNIIGDRLGSVIFGISTIPFFYLFLNLEFNKKTALIATILLATSHMWIALSRLGVTYTQAGFFIIITLYFLFSGFKSDKKIYFLLSGISLGIGMYSYYAIRALPVIILIPIIFYLLDFKKIKKTIINLVILFTTTIIILIPQGIFYLQNRDSFTSRASAVYIFSEPAIKWNNFQSTSNLKIIAEQTKKTFNIFEGDNSTQYNFKGQLLDYFSITLFIIGVYATLRLKIKIKIFLFMWLLISIASQVLTSVPSPIFLPRFVIGLPVLYIFIALGIMEFSKIINYINLRYISTIFIVCAVITLVAINLINYFILYPKQPTGDLGSILATSIGNLINKQDNNSIIYFYTEPYLYADYGTLSILSPNSNRVSLGIPRNTSDFNISNLEISDNSIFIVYPQYSFVLSKLRSVFPSGKTLSFKNNENQLLFYSYKVN